MDEESFIELKNGGAAKTKLSHDQNLFHLGQAALDEGYQVYITGPSTEFRGAARRVYEFFPQFLASEKMSSGRDLSPLIVATVHPQLLRFADFENAIKVGIHPALYFLEMPWTYNAKQNADLIYALRDHIDYLIVQNERMKEFISAAYEWVAGWTAHERILSCPLGLHADEAVLRANRADSRKALGIGLRDLVLINGGGVWGWTDFPNFLRGFIAARRTGAAIRLLLSGLRQPDNPDHAEQVAVVQSILDDNRDLLWSSTSKEDWAIRVPSSWEIGTQELPTLLSAADAGISVNTDSLENWQSHRVRILDYLRYGLPVITTEGSLFSSDWGAEAAITLTERDADGYKAAILKLTKSDGYIKSKSEGVTRVVGRLISSNPYREILRHMILGGRRDKARRSRGALDLARQLAMERLESWIGLAEVSTTTFRGFDHDQPRKLIEGRVDLTFEGNDRALKTRIGKRGGGVIALCGEAGVGLYGPHVSVPPGDYRAELQFDGAVQTSGRATLEVTCESGAEVIAIISIDGDKLAEESPTVGLAFSSRNSLINLEVRLICDEGFQGAIRSVRLRSLSSNISSI
jgi:hypothetical protein